MWSVAKTRATSKLSVLEQVQEENWGNWLTYMYVHLAEKQLFYDPLSRTTWVNRYQEKHSPTILIIIHSSSASSIYYNP